ncbi:lipid-A-disaccharide synthase N-terminal domain-containing protein [Kordia sp. YSTF-M3]|uniref:Lipid-A-disaccharide synthase N-terminal domain-containing protein n=1 Tax=Kordia aestuariivivens TaxID=2759037 RepID=A0ABR7Q8D1_9FLAO|nr:lipid-A-disaccharide synthase N-terminal domain-containing protein [Kordia aestuariivivens]MBC8754611.1 lipid-A-disaccharide synthase N-terminal domain-containing protein [Kordia aestuariivivens]
MTSWYVFAIGALAQLLFSGRTLLQWIISEKKKKVLTPSLFWKLSLIASFLLFIYGYLRDDLAIMLGQVLTYFIYIRNMQLQGEWRKMHQFIRIFILIFPLIIIAFGYNNKKQDVDNLLNNEAIPDWLLILGVVAQIIFTLRFVYQWIYSEKQKQSSLPFGFWMLSLLGSSLIFTYAIFRKDPILIAGHVFGIVTYVRNIMLLRNQS